MSNTLMVGVVYENVKPFLQDYFASVNQQTDKDFDLLIVNDGLDEEALEPYKGFHTIHNTDNTSIAGLRQTIIEFAREKNYKTVIFTDTDDYNSENRVSCTKHYLQQYDFVFNELTLVDNESNIISRDFLSGIVNQDELDDLRTLMDKNVVGLGNSAINLASAHGIDIPDDIIAVDWYLFSCLLLQKKKGRFIKECQTYYRQHPDNLIGMKGSMNSDKLMLGINVKEKQYTHMLKFCIAGNYQDQAAQYKRRLEELEELKGELANDVFSDRYIATINRKYDTVFTGWWSDVLTINQFQSYAD